MAARLREHYSKMVVPARTKEFGYTYVMAVPKLAKIALNIGMGEATQNAKLVDGAARDLGLITGQKPIVTKATKSIQDYLLYAREFDTKFPGFETDIHGLRFEPIEGGGRRYLVDCVAEKKARR